MPPMPRRFSEDDEYVTRRELASQLEPLHDDVREIKEDVKLVRQRYHELIQLIGNLQLQVSVADAVKAALEKQADKGFSKTEKLIGLAISLILLALTLYQAIT